MRVLFRVSVEESDKHKHYWATRSHISETTIEKILSSKILIVPWENRSDAGETFPAGTSDFYWALTKTLGEGAIAIAAEPDSYKELSLHADHVRWPTLVIAGTFVIEILTGVISDQISYLIQQPDPPKILEMTLIVENASGKCISINYSGPPLRALDTLVSEAAACLPKDAHEIPSEINTDDVQHDVPNENDDN